MLGLILLIVFVILFLTKKNSNLIFLYGFFYLWLVFGWCTKPGDLEIYQDRYESWDSDFFQSITEPLYTWTIALFHYLKLDFWQSVIVLSFIFLLSLFSVIYKLTKNKNFVLALLLISIYPMLITLLRNTYSFSFSLFSFYFLLYGKPKVKFLFFILFVFVATFIHSMNILFVLFLIPYINSYKTCYKFSFGGFIVTAILAFLYTKNSSVVMGVFGMSSKSDLVLAANDMATDSPIITFVLSVLKVLSIMALPIIFQRYADNHKIRLRSEEVAIIKFNIFGLVFLPLLILSFDIYRLFLLMAIINFCLLSRYIRIRWVYVATIIYALNIGYWVLYRHYFDRLFLGVFMNNAIL